MFIYVWVIVINFSVLTIISATLGVSVDENVLVASLNCCSFIFELFGKSNLSFETKAVMCDVIDKLITFLTSEGW